MKRDEGARSLFHTRSLTTKASADEQSARERSPAELPLPQPPQASGLQPVPVVLEMLRRSRFMAFYLKPRSTAHRTHSLASAKEQRYLVAVAKARTYWTKALWTC